MSEHLKRILDWVMPTTTFISAMTLADAQAYLSIAVAIATLAWYAIRFYDRFVHNKKAD